ncbi:MAG: isoprenylcysteine carboxylmethyltransferase family protein [Gammaproteobacteria bacterium]|nr:isoprenylcysteine carboxylmethyltransferase family protein [Gammaproteobacteria bacterium]
MQALELKIPPPAVAALIAVAMWGVALITPLLEIPTLVRVVAAASLALAGVVVSLAGVVAFRRARTTVNPMKPETASALVCTGVYKITRNPMYVGLLLLLIAWAVFRSSAWALLGPVVFVLYINRFQIAAEERVLATLFGTGYTDYKARVRRWL